MRNTLYLSLVLGLAILIMCNTANLAYATTTTLYAAPTDQGTHDCLSAPNACDLQEALDLADTETNDTTINLAAGTYTQSGQYVIDDIPFTYKITLVGAGTSSTFITSTGDNGIQLNTGGAIEVSGIDFKNNHSAGLYSTGQGNQNIHDNKFEGNGNSGLYFSHTAGAATVTIDNNNFTGNNISGSDGGAIHMFSNTDAAFSPTISNNDFTDNTVTGSGNGGAVYLYVKVGTITVTQGNNFSGNTALSGHAGALYVDTQGADSDISVGVENDDGNAFDSNQSGSAGGAMFLKTHGAGSSISVSENVFTNNVSTSDGAFILDTDGLEGDRSILVVNNTIGGLEVDEGNIANDGGAGGGQIYAAGGLTFSGNIVEGNTATGDAGGINFTFDGAESNSFNHTIVDNTFSYNAAGGNEGGFNISTDIVGSLSISRNIVTHNTASGGEAGGGRLGMEYIATAVVVTDNLFANNSSVSESGGFDYYSAADAPLDFVNNTMVDNTVSFGRAGDVNFGINNGNASLNIYNNIFWGSTASGDADDVGVENFSNSSVIFNHNDVGEICLLGDTDICPAINGSTAHFTALTNIKKDPLFNVGTFVPSYFSPVVDAGNSSLNFLPEGDLNDDGRIQGNDVDLGAYETAPFSDGLVGDWHLDENSGTTAVDSSNSGNDGTVTGTPHWVDGRVDNALSFDGKSNYITIDRPVADDFTICAWIKTKTVGDGTDHYRLAPIMDAEVPNSAADFGFGVDSNGDLAYGNGFSDVTVNGATSIADDNWHHACVTRNRTSGAVKLYVDGNVDATGTTQTVSVSDNSLARIGYGFDGAKFFKGLIDEVSAYNVTLSDFDIEHLYDATPAFVKSHSTGGSSVVGYVNSNQIDNNINTEPTITDVPNSSGNSDTSVKFTRTLKMGMTGDDVKALQVYLNTHGFPLATTGNGSLNNETTYFGQKTKNAVIKFQQAHPPLQIDGIVGPQTQIMMK